MWEYHNQKMMKLKKIYQKTSKQTQNRLQEIFNSIDFSFQDMYKIADNKTKKRIDTYIEEWQDKGLLKGYFGTLANNIYKRTRVKNNEIFELLIYGAYIEEQNKLKEPELNIFKDIVNHYYQQGQKEVNKTLPKKKIVSVIPDAIFLALLDMPNAKGYTWSQYIETIAQYNAQTIFRQATIDLQQQKELDITNDIYQNLIKRQNNSKLNINGDKISGDVDLTLIGINNKSKTEGMLLLDKNAKCRFIAVEDDVTTQMCKSLDGQIFNVHNINEFKRYSKSNDTIKQYKCYGMITGLNLPPIDDGFHWCRSTITYQVPVEKQEKTEYNGLASDVSNNVKEHLKPKILERINYNDEKEVIETLKKYEDIIKNDTNENAIVVIKNGEVYQCYGDTKNVWPDYDLQDNLQEAYMTHNHPKDETQYSFSEDDIALFNNYNLKILRGIDEKYTYELTRDPSKIDEITIDDMMDEENGIHALNINRASKFNIGYRRWNNE